MNVDSLKFIALENKMDSLNVVYKSSIKSLSNLVDKNNIGQNFFTDILSHQWSLLSYQTAIFIGIILILVAVLGLLSWSLIFKRINVLEKNADSYNTALKKILEIEQRLEIVRTNTLRSLYEGTNNKMWKFIWHIRYCECFYDRDLHAGLLTRIGKLNEQYIELKKYQPHFIAFVQFKNQAGIIKILQKMVQSNDPEVVRVTSSILSEFNKIEDNACDDSMSL